MHDTGFPLSAAADAQVLILGSMPSRKSLADDQYYAHPHNAFWPIMAALLGFDPQLPYADRLQQLRLHRVALWDVAYQCVRPGSMDHAIAMDSVVANDFAALFSHYSHIRMVFFNGQKAGELYRKKVLPQLPDAFRQIPSRILPSTSPANAAASRSQKLRAWQIVKQALETD